MKSNKILVPKPDSAIVKIMANNSNKAFKPENQKCAPHLHSLRSMQILGNVEHQYCFTFGTGLEAQFHTINLGDRNRNIAVTYEFTI